MDKSSRSLIVGKLSGVLAEGGSERETTGQDSKAQPIKGQPLGAGLGPASYTQWATNSAGFDIIINLLLAPLCCRAAARQGWRMVQVREHRHRPWEELECSTSNPS